MKIKTKRAICFLIGAAAFLAVLLVADGMDRFVIPAGRGALLQGVCVAVWAATWWKAGVIRP